jgi:hypothetical protein
MPISLRSISIFPPPPPIMTRTHTWFHTFRFSTKYMYFSFLFMRPTCPVLLDLSYYISCGATGKTYKISKLSLCFSLTEHHAMKVYWRSGFITPRILDLGTRWRWVVSFTPLPLYTQGNSPWCPLHRRLDGPQSRSGRGGEEKNSQPPSGIEP